MSVVRLSSLSDPRREGTAQCAEPLVTGNESRVPARPAAGGLGAGGTPLSSRSDDDHRTHTFRFPIEVLGLQTSISSPAHAARSETHRGLAAPELRGRHLPVTREIAADGFSATWRISELASEAPRVLSSCGDPACKAVDVRFRRESADPWMSMRRRIAR